MDQSNRDHFASPWQTPRGSILIRPVQALIKNVSGFGHPMIEGLDGPTI